MKLAHWKKPLLALAATIGAAIPAILVDPSFAHYVAQHPWVDTWLPIVIVLVHTFEKKPTTP